MFLFCIIRSKVFELLVVLLTTLVALRVVDRRDDWVADFLQVLHLLGKGVLIGVLVGVEPVLGLRDGVHDGALVVLLQLLSELVLIFDRVAHGVDVVLKGVLGVDAFLDGFVLISELLGIIDHLLDFLGSEAALVVSNGDSLGLADTLLNTGDGQDGVLVNLEGDLNLGNTTSRGRDAGKIELAELMVVFDHGALTFDDGDGDGSLLVLVGSESLGFLGGDNSTALDDRGHDAADGLNTESKGSHINEKQILTTGSLATEDATLNGSTVSDSFVRVDATVGLLAVEEVLDELLDLRDTSGATDEDNFINFAALQTRIVKDGLDGLQGVLEQIVTELLELGAGERLFEVNAVHEGLNDDLDLLDGREVTLGLLDL